MFHRPTEGDVPAIGDTVPFGLGDTDAASWAAEETLDNVNRQTMRANHNVTTRRRLEPIAESRVPTLNILFIRSAC